MSIVYTEKDKCKGCYACIRACPCKAIKVENGLAEVMKERCIACGTCLQVCVTKAKLVESDVGVVRQLLNSGSEVIAIPSSAFPAALPDMSSGQFVTALKKLGFSEVIEDAFGAELVCREYKRLAIGSMGRLILTTNCPAVVSYIEKFYPQLVANLAPVVSPMIATGRLIKKIYKPDAKVVFIGPCVAKKAENKDEKVSGFIDAVLTFSEIKDMFNTAGIKPANEVENLFDGPQPDMGRLISVSRGLLEAADLSDNILQHEVISVHGREYVKKILKEISRGEIYAKFINMHFCHGCIDGPAIGNEHSTFRRKELVASYAAAHSDPGQTEKDLQKYASLELKRNFSPQSVGLPTPSEEEIQTVLLKMNKARPENQFNCGSCGYESCRELAIAVCQSLAEVNMCWPYVTQQLKETQAGLIQAEKLTSLGQLAASIAHEVNNPLAGVLVYTQLLTKKVESRKFSEDVALGYLSKMESELTRSTKLIRNLLDFARQSPPSLREVDVNEVVNLALDLASHSAQLYHVVVDKQMDSSIPKIMADFDQLRQVFVNLIVNAIQAMLGGGTLSIRTYSADGQIKTEVRDTGCGISPENMYKLFTPFFTTKKEVKGVGLGLAVSYGIIQRHKGKIEVKSKEGEGTTFTVCLPMKNEYES